MKIIKRTSTVLLNFVILFSVTLALPAPVLSQEPAGDHEAPPTKGAAQAPESGDFVMSPTDEPPPIDCSKPLPGERTTLGVDDEIIVAYISWMTVTIDKWDNTSKTDKNLKHKWTWSKDKIDLYKPRSMALTTTDLDGDSKAEVISGFCSDDVQMLEAVSLKNPEVSSGIEYDLWSSSHHDREGENMGYIMAAGAGNLDGALGGDEAGEVVLAFSDANQNLQLVLLDGESDGGIIEMGYWISSDHARYNVNDISVAVGDLDGDGYDDEIAVALSDGYEVLQVIVLEYNGSGGLKELAYQRFIGASQVDVTTGAISGGGKDEIAAAFADSNGWIHIGVFEYDQSNNSVNSLGWWKDDSNYRDNVDYVSVASGDIDGDGWDEIVTAFQDRNDNFQIVSLDSESGTPKFRGSFMGGEGNQDVKYVSVDAGDIDEDGKAEVVVTLSDYDWMLQVLPFDDNSNCPCKDDGDGLKRRDFVQTGGAGLTLVALDDIDGNNLYADYTGVCEKTYETRLISMVDRPPYWEALNPDTDVAYASTIKGGDVTEDHITNSYGGSATFDSSFDFGVFELGSTFTKEWNHSITQSWAHGSSLETRAGWTSPNDGLVTLNTVTYYTYQYKKRDGSGLVRVSVPVETQTDSKKMTYWNQGDGARELFPESWVPAYRTAWMDKQNVEVSYGDTSQWIGSDFYDINNNGKQDYLITWIDDPNAGYIWYQIGWDMDKDGSAYWDGSKYPSVEAGTAVSGLGAALTELNGNGKPELVVAWVENPSGNNNAYYSVGWDIPADPGSWSAKKQIPGWVGGSTEGVGLDIVDLSGDGHPEMFFGWIDNPGGVNHGHYRVGWDMDANGDIDNWWAEPKTITGAFGAADAGLGLTLADMDGGGGLDLIAAWVRNPEGDNDWAYSVGENLDGDAHVDDWVPGHPIPGLGIASTYGAALASANLVDEDSGDELVVSWIDNPQGANKAYLRVGKYWQLGGEVDQRPTDIDDPVAKDGMFKIKLYDLWWETNGDLLWRWDKMAGPPPPIYISVGGGDPYWKVEKDSFTQQTVATSESYNYAVGGEAKFLGIGADGSKTWGFEEGSSYSISWEKGFFMDGLNNGLPGDSQYLDKEYKYNPFTYMQEAMSKTGVKQAYMVLDYFVPWRGSDTAGTSTVNVSDPSSPLETPGVPIIDSPTHPDPGTWYPVDTAAFTWTQPPGDPAVVDGYRWYLDHDSDTIPAGVSMGLINATTYEGLSDGLWYLHLRARSDGGDWSETAHRAIRLDTNPPEVEIELEPPLPVANDGWYNTPVTTTVIASDTTGSGVQNIEVSNDGLSWLPYTTPLVFNTETPPTTIWARASDALSHISEPISTTFGLDMTAPTSVETPGCWSPGGICAGEVFTDSVGNQYIQLRGELDDALSDPVGLSIRVNDGNWTTADEIGESQWSFTTSTELGAGCHTFNIQAEDRAGNLETLHDFNDEVVWHPREQPDLSGSSFMVLPDQVRPGDIVTFSALIPNSSWQETWVPIRIQVPPGLHVQEDTISSDGVYNPSTRVITWAPGYIWPGRERRLTFSAQVDSGLMPSDLVVSLEAIGTWPIADTCPLEELTGFFDFQTIVERTTTLTVDPTLPDDADFLPPVPHLLRTEAGTATNVPEVQLRIAADADAQWMYLREWTWSESSGTWVTVQESSWLPYTASYPWTLSQGDGVKYLGVWLADAAGNVSALDRSSLAYTNLLGGNQYLSDGGRIQYRFPLYKGALAVFNVIAHEGNPDLYSWRPLSGFRPHYAATGTGFVDAIGFWVNKMGRYLVEVKAEGDSRYQLLLAGDISLREAILSDVTASIPEHPLTVSDPLSAGVAVAPDPPGIFNLYFPLIMKDD